MPELNSTKRAQLPNSAFAYVDSRGERRLPIHDEGHVRNALSRFNQVKFEDEEARERARKRLLNAAKKYKIVPVGFVTGQIQSEREFGQSQRRNATLPTGLVTLMMTDIEGSTNLVHQLGKDYAKLIREIRTMIRKVVVSQLGHVVDVRADEAFAVFKRPGDAVAGAVAIQRAIGERPPPHEVRIRIGLHSGKPTVSDGNYIGIAVHTAARICSAAHGGQIVLSAQTRDAVKDPTVDGLRFRSLGSHRLRGLPEAVALYQVSVEGLAVKFPRLKIDSK